MQRSVAIICAPHRNNSGMYSVDRAADHWVKSINMVPVHFRTQIDFGRKSMRYGKHKFRRYRAVEDLAGFDKVLFWGDFQNNPAYGLDDFTKREKRHRYSIDPKVAFDNWLSICLLGKCRPENALVISVSNNFQTLSEALVRAGDVNAKRVGTALSHNFDYLFPRDPVSEKALRDVLSDDASAVVGSGVDAAFLLDGHSLASEVSKEKGFVYSFGRSFPGQASDVVTAAENVTGIPGADLGQWLKLGRFGVESRFQDFLGRLKSARLS